jgi:hypothetical protein
MGVAQLASDPIQQTHGVFQEFSLWMVAAHVLDHLSS